MMCCCVEHREQGDCPRCEIHSITTFRHPSGNKVNE